MDEHAVADGNESTGKPLIYRNLVGCGMLEELVDFDFLRWQNTHASQLSKA
jgi:hypothetical protein